MSQANVEIVVGALEAAPGNPEAFFSIFDESAEFDVSANVPDAGTYHGPEGVREFFRNWVGVFDDFGYDVEEVIDAGDSVIVSIHQWGTGRGSGARVDYRFWQAWTLRGGKVVLYKDFPERVRALEAVGLSEYRGR